MRGLARLGIALACVVLAPAAAYAQGSIVGVVKDTSGAVLPGVSFAKILRFGGTRTSLNLELYNALNANPIPTQSNNFGAWQQPQSILLARFVTVSAQFDF